MNISEKSLGNKKLFALLALPLAVAVSITITEVKWMYGAAILLAPLLLYLSFKRPFIFPFGIYVFSIPFENILIMNGAKHGPTLTRLLGILAIIAILLKGLYEKRLKAPGKINLWWVLFSFYCILSTLWGISAEFPLVRIVTIIGLAGLYLVASTYQVTKQEYDYLKWFLVSGGLLSAVLTIIAYHQGLLELGEAERVSMMSLDNGGGMGLVNKQAFDMLLPFSICIGMIFERRKPIFTGFLFITFLLIFFSMMITGSRGGLAAGLAALFYFIFSKRDKLKSIIIAGLILMVTFAMTPQFYLDRINRSLATGASGRFDIWHVGMKALGKYWLFGAGLDCFPNAYTEFVNYTPVYMGLDRAPHNVFIGSFVELGIIGGMLLLTALFMHYLAIGPSKKGGSNDQSILKAAFWAILVGSLTQDVLWYKSFWLLWMMIVMLKNSENGLASPFQAAQNA
ncbi:MAG: O-antigen ligase family protein [Nitrospiraceae bacterium]|nr:O-antigen ligase family protein [Nitrospiraceae bacterium]